MSIGRALLAWVAMVAMISLALAPLAYFAGIDNTYGWSAVVQVSLVIIPITITGCTLVAIPIVWVLIKILDH